MIINIPVVNFSKRLFLKHGFEKVPQNNIMKETYFKGWGKKTKDL